MMESWHHTNKLFASGAMVAKQLLHFAVAAAVSPYAQSKVTRGVDVVSSQVQYKTKHTAYCATVDSNKCRSTTFVKKPGHHSLPSWPEID
jgi:hypothetical protein